MASNGPELYRKAKTLIPGGTQLLSKRPEMFLPEHWPSYMSKTKGVDVWDLDGNHYIDMTYNGIGANILGAADPDVDAAVRKAIDSGTMATLNCPEEVELAELLCELHPWAEQVRFARCGGEIMAMAIRIARAATGKDLVAFCGYHGWHDWYLAANLGDDGALDGHLLPGLLPKGVPRALKGTAFPFRYNHVEELEKIVAEHPGKIGVIAMEPLRNRQPDAGFLETVRKIADAIGAVLIFDEVSAGFRLNTGGAHLLYGVEPDIAVFAKGMSNGYPMAAVIGKKSVMNAAQETFISSTYWTERIGPTAALATIRKHRAKKVHEHLMAIGTQVQEGWKKAAAETNLEIEVSGIPPLSHLKFTKESIPARTLYTQLMLEKGFLASGAFYATYAHTKKHVDDYIAATIEAFATIAEASKNGSLATQLKGPVAHTDFHRLT